MMQFWEQMAIIAICGVATLCTRFLPFILFKDEKGTGNRMNYIGRTLPAALFAMLVVYCLKDVDFVDGSHGLQEIASIAVIILVHVKWRNMLLSIVVGMASYLTLDFLL